ncbi:hypothetical protein ACHAXT_011723 [Thalassiosira profunda]
MKEAPLINHHPLLPLPGASTGGGDGGAAGWKEVRRVVASIRAPDTVGDDAPSPAVGVVLTEQYDGRPNNLNEATSTALVPADTAGSTTNINSGFASPVVPDPQEEIHALTGLASVRHSDGRAIVTGGMAGQKGVIRLSLRDTGESSGLGAQDGAQDVDIDLTILAHGGTAGFESPAVGAACFLTREDEGSVLRLRAVDLYGTVLSLAFAYPDLIPLSDQSFLLPLSPKEGLHPHPGASVEVRQVCFPTPTTVIFALNPHLYCVDLGGHAGEVVTRVWTNVHRVTSDPVSDASSETAPTPRKKARKGLGGVLLGMVGMGSGGEANYEYDDSGDYCNGSAAIPSIAALAHLPSDDASPAARVATLHSDGSLRVWIAEPSLKDSHRGQLRIPAVQRVAVSQGGTWTTPARVADPPLPPPSAWDRAREAVAVRGRHWEGNRYEVAAHVRCYAALRVEGAGAVCVLRGGIVGGDEEEGASSGIAEMQTLALPKGTRSVVDLSWTGRGDLMVLLKRGDALDSSEALYDLGSDENVGTAVALYPKEARGNSYAEEPTLPATTTLAYWGLNRYGDPLAPSPEEEFERFLIVDEDSEGADAEAAMDRAGLRAILQPLGRPRPSSLAVYRALSSLGLADGAATPEDLRPATILAAVRRWKQRAAFRSASRALVPVEDEEDLASSPAPTGLSVYHAFASATKSKRGSLAGRSDDEEAGAEGGAPERAHRSRWARLLSEIRRQESHLDAALRLERPSAPSGAPYLVRGGTVSILALDDDDAATASRENETAAALDELAVDVLERAASDPELRRLLFQVEAALYDAAATASCLMEGWSTAGTAGADVALLSQLELLGRSAAAGVEMTDAQLGLLRELALRDRSAEGWLASHASDSPSVARRLALSRTFGRGKHADVANGGSSGGHDDATRAAASVVASQLDAGRRLALARLLLALGIPGGGPPAVRRAALRSALHSTALCWAIHRPSRVEPQHTILEHRLSSERMARGVSGGAAPALRAAERFAPEALVAPSAAPRLWSEPRAALRLLAPLLEFASPAAGEAAEDALRERRKDVAECLLAEAASVARSTDSSASEKTSPEALWRLASRLLLDNAEATNEYVERVKTLAIHLGPMEGNTAVLPLCCGFILEAVQDAVSCDDELPAEEEGEIRSAAFPIAMRGNLWDEALEYCGAFHNADETKSCLKTLVLRMVDEGAIGKLVDMSLSVVGDSREELDLFTLATAAIEGAAIEKASSQFLGSIQDEERIATSTNYWGCLYTLHASRGDWRKAACAMDVCGKAIANSVSSANLRGSLTTAASKKIMDAICSSTQACAHAIGQVVDPSRRYLLLGQRGEAASGQSRLHTQEDLERRAARALALRTISLDEYAPDSVGNILELSSKGAIDNLARLGYYDQAIALASDLSAQKGAMMNGVDWFDNALTHVLCTYLVPAAIRTRGGTEEGGVMERLQSRSKMAQIRAASSACALSVGMPPGQPRSVATHSANAQSSEASGCAVQEAMAMGLLRQYTTMYSKRCQGLALKVADAILQAGSGTSQLPLWLVELCLWGIPGEEKSESGLFAQSKIADPAGLMRLYIKHHQYGAACGVVTSILSKKTTSEESSRLPEKGSVDFVPYDLIDQLWSMIENIAATNAANTSADVKAQVQSLVDRRDGMEQALEKHFASLKISEEGIKSARALASAARVWKTRVAFRSASRALVPVDDEEERRGSPAPTGRSVYRAFASATKAKRGGLAGRSDDEEAGEGAEAPDRAHRSRWARLLSEIRRQESHLAAALRLERPSASGAPYLVRVSTVSVLALDDDESATASRDNETVAALDELAVDVLETAASDPELRRLLLQVEAALYDAAATASCLMEGWSTAGTTGADFALSRLELLGRSAAAGVEMTDAQLGLLRELALQDQSAAGWLTSHASDSPSVARRLALSGTFGRGKHADVANGGSSGGLDDATRAAASVIASQLDAGRRLALARLLLALGVPGGGPSVRRAALRSALHSTALCWAIHRPSRVEPQQTILEHRLSSERMARGVSGGAAPALRAAERFAPEALVAPSAAPRLRSEPRAALRLLAPLLALASPAAGAAAEDALRERRKDVAECLLAEAASIAQNADSSTGEKTSPEALWRLASRLLLANAEATSEYVDRVKTLAIHLGPMEGNKAVLPLCCGFVLEAVQDAVSCDEELPAEEEHEIRSAAFSIAMRGHLWDEALEYCGAFPDVDETKSCLTTLVLRMVDEGATGKLVDMSLSVVGDGTEELDLFTLATAAIEEAAIEMASSQYLGSIRDEERIATCTNYWGCLYTLHASRGDWRKAAYAMDVCGKAMANSVSSANLRGSLTTAASKKIMDAICSSTQACAHAIGQVEDPSRRYLLLGQGGDAASGQSRLHTQDDLERRAARALALRTISLDEYAPDSVSNILESSSKGTIDTLARLGYFDQAIALASDLSAQKGAMMNGVDWFDNALAHVLCTYLVPAAIRARGGTEEGSVMEHLQSRSKMAQIRAASSACALSVGMPPGQSRSVATHSANAQSSEASSCAVQEAMAMGLLRQYTTMHSERCQGLALKVADALLRAGNGPSKLPLWLEELCLWGIPEEETSESGLFAQSMIADPAGLMRLYIKHHQYGAACGVVTSILSKKTTSEESSRLPEKGNVDFVPYDLIDQLWSMIEDIAASNASSTSADVKAQVQSLVDRRDGMEQALEKHFASLKISEEGIKSARALACA